MTVRKRARTISMLLDKRSKKSSASMTSFPSRFRCVCVPSTTASKARIAASRSRMLSADVNVLHDPNYADVSSPNNTAIMNAGVVVGNGSDIGGGASIQGTLSGGGTEQITIGERCLLGANAGIERGSLQDTVICEGSKIGSQVAIGHGVRVGAHTLMVAQTGVAGPSVTSTIWTTAQKAMPTM